MEQEHRMGIINIYLKDSGSIANLQKDFPLYKGAYQNNKIDIYVPITLLPSTANHIASVKTAMIITKPNGDQTTTTSYNAPLKTENVVVDNVTYNLYEQTLPQKFTSESGDQTVIANVIEIDNTDPEHPTTVRIITSQTATLPILNSDYIDNEEVEDPSQLEYVTALLNEKQDKIDPSIIANGTLTTSSVVTSINELNTQVTQNTQAINGTEETDGILDRLTTAEGDIDDIQAEQVIQNNDISQNANDIDTLETKVANLEDIVGSGEDYVGTYPVPPATSTLDPNNESQLATLKSNLTAYVLSLRENVEGGDVVIYIQTVTSGTDRNYKFIYSGSINDWTFFEIPATEKANDTTYGIVKGTYLGDPNLNTWVHIVDGEIQGIALKDYGAGTRKDLADFVNLVQTKTNTNTTNITNLDTRMTNQENKTSTLDGQVTNILNGTTTVPVADKANKDGNGNNIVNTYLTQTAGVTKTQLKEYALPRAFNDVSFIGANNEMVDTVPDSVSALYTATSTSVGETTLCYVQKTIGDVEYQLASKNSYSNAIYVTASANCSVQFSVVTSIYDSEDENWLVGNVELTDVVSMTANEIKKINFGSPLNYLDSIVNIKQGDIIQQTFSVVTSTSETISFDVYSNEVYPSTFYLNTTSQVVTTQAGDLGEIPVYGLSGTYDSGTNTITFNASASATINENTYCLFKCSYADPIATGTKINIGYGLSTLRIITPPYNKSSSADATIDDFDSFYTAGVGLEFEGVIQNISGDLVVYATMGGGSGGGSDQTITITTTPGSESISDETNTLNVETRDTAQTITAQKTHTAPFTVDIQTSEGGTSVEEGLNVGGGLDMFSVEIESTEGTETTTTQSQSGLYSGYPVMGVSQTVADSSTQEETTVDHSVMVTEDGVFIDGANIASTYQKQTDNNLNTTNKTIVGAINELQSGQTAIDEVIPAQASLSNQLADKSFVNSSISTNTANFIGTFADIPSLNAYSGTVTNNDYAFVMNSVIKDNGSDWANTTDLNAYDKTLLTEFDYAWVINGSKFDLYRFDIINQTWGLRVSNTDKADVTLNTAFNRYKAVVSGSTVTWLYEYTLNNSSFTASQWASINSGITASDVTQIGTNTTNIGTLSSNKADKSATVSNVSYASANKKIQQTINGTTTDVVTLGDNAFTNTHIPVYTEESQTIASNSWHSLVAQSDVYKYTATVSITHTIGADTEVGIAVDNVLQFAEYGFAIGLVAGQNIDVFSAKQPSNSVTLTFTFKD